MFLALSPGVLYNRLDDLARAVRLAESEMICVWGRALPPGRETAGP
ncbi:MAG: hypothetical protein PWQ39_1494 [Thermacetogenium sp.]|nr:hypothetical protein [Thermacetogenium sp.]